MSALLTSDCNSFTRFTIKCDVYNVFEFGGQFSWRSVQLFWIYSYVPMTHEWGPVRKRNACTDLNNEVQTPPSFWMILVRDCVYIFIFRCVTLKSWRKVLLSTRSKLSSWWFLCWSSTSTMISFHEQQIMPSESHSTYNLCRDQHLGLQ